MSAPKVMPRSSTPTRHPGRTAVGTLLAAVLTLSVLVSGCSFGPREDPSRFYLLPGPGDAIAPDVDEADGLVVGLGPLTLPAYLDRPEVVLRRSPTEVDVRHWDRWAEPLEDALTRTLAESLRSTVGVRQVASFPWRGRVPVDRSVEVEVVRFECEEGGDAVLEARWRVRGADGTPTGGGTFRDRSAPDGASLDACVTAMARVARALGQALASEL